MSDRDRLAADLYQALTFQNGEVGGLGIIADRLLALGWKKVPIDACRHEGTPVVLCGDCGADYLGELDEERLARALREWEFLPTGYPVTVILPGSAEEAASYLAKAYREDEG